MNIPKVKGTYDVLPSDSYKWQALEKEIHHVCKLYNIHEIRTPIMEYSDVFHRQSEQSDMVTKETYNFLDKSERLLTLRPEGTAGIMRSYVEHKLYASQDVEKVYYLGPNFRYERPQKGRYRQFSQFGVEAIGALNPSLDAEIIMLSYDFIQRLGLKGVTVKINSLGDLESQKTYKNALIKHFQPHQETLCKDCQQRIDKNPLRILDCKIDQNHQAVIDAPSPFDFLSADASAYHKDVLKHLDEANIPYQTSNRLVRGLDYYSHTVFEIEANIKGFGAQNVLGGGGRYQNLIKELGGPDVGGIGFAFGMERLLIALEAENIRLDQEPTLDAYIITMNQTFKPLALNLLYELRKLNIVCDMNYSNKAFKGQLKQALKQEAKYLLILGEDELNEQKVSVKNTKDETQEKVSLHQLNDYLLKQLENNI